MVVLIAMMIIAFLVTVAFSVDVAYMQLTRVKLRAATDAAARAAGGALSRTQDIDAARQAARDMAAANLVAGQPLKLDDSDIVFGNSTLQPDGAWAFAPNVKPINSVQVLGRRTDGSPSGSVPTFFGRVIGVYDFQPTQTATAVRLDRDVCLVVDRSNSMKLYLSESGSSVPQSDRRYCEPPHGIGGYGGGVSRWAALAGAVDGFVDELANTPQIEHVALVSYASNFNACNIRNTEAQINQPLDRDHTRITSAMGGISSTAFNGYTNIAAGIDKGIAALTDPSRARPYAFKTMVLMTDGRRTAGGSPVEAAQRAADREITIHTITFGDGADQKEMRAVADATDGNHYHAPDAKSLKEIFREVALTMPVVLTQ